MMSRRQLAQRFTPAFLAVVLAGALFVEPAATILAVTPPSLSPFVPAPVVGKPIGIAATASRLLITDCDTNGSPEVLSVGSRGGVTRPAFATLPGACGDNYIAIAPGPRNPHGVRGYPSPNEAGFPSNFLFVTGHTAAQVPAIFEVGLRGGVAQFATIPAATCPSFGGITFDRVGSFRNRLVAVCSGGQVWLIGPVTITAGDGAADPVTCPSAACQLIATVPTAGGAVAGGPDIAPSTARLPGLAGGALLVAVKSAQGPGSIFAVSSPSGAVTQLTTVAAPESTAVIPRTMCSYAPWTASPDSSPVYFAVGDGPNAVGFLPQRTFTGHAAGNVLVAGTAGSGITTLGSANGKIATSSFAATGASLRASAFVDCAAPLLLGTFRRESAIVPGAGGVVSVWILQTPNFNPLTVCVGHGVTAAGDTCPLAADPMQTPPTYGVTGTEASFDECGSSLVSTPQGPALECRFYRNRLGIRTPSNTGRPASRIVTAAAAGVAACGSGFALAGQVLAPGCEVLENLLGLQPPTYTGRLIVKLSYVGGPTGGAGGIDVSGGLPGSRSPNAGPGPGPHGNGQGSGGGQGSGEQGDKGIGHDRGGGHGGDGDAEGDD